MPGQPAHRCTIQFPVEQVSLAQAMGQLDLTLLATKTEAQYELSLVKRSLLDLAGAGAAGATAWWLVPKKVAAEERYVTAPLEPRPHHSDPFRRRHAEPGEAGKCGQPGLRIVKKLYADFNDRVQPGRCCLNSIPR